MRVYYYENELEDEFNAFDSFAIQLAQSAQVDELSRIFGKWEGTERFLKEYGVSLQGFGYYSLTQPETNVYQFTVYRDS